MLTALALMAGLVTQQPTTTAEMWEAWCARCHAQDGSGKLAEPTITVEPMDFSDCKIATPETDVDWEIAIAEGGPAVGLSSEMPAFGASLTPQQIRAFIPHIRSMCRERRWPIGNANFPRPIFTEKAFPENELVILPMITHRRLDNITLSGAPFATDLSLTDFDVRAIFERRLARRGMWEVALPIASHDTTAFARRQGIGDLELAFKYVLYASEVSGFQSSSPSSPRIVSAGLEVVLPTGSEVRGLGAGTTVVEPYIAAGTLVGNMYIQAQGKLELPVDTTRAARAFVYNLYVGGDTSSAPNTWTIGVELNGELIDPDATSADTGVVRSLVALTPQVRKGLTKTGALAAALGVQVPINERRTRGTRVVSYVLWEYLEPVRPRP